MDTQLDMFGYEPPPRYEDSVQRIFEHWRDRSGKSKAKLTPKRRQKVTARLEDGYTEAEIIHGIDGCLGNEWNVDNEYVDLELICRSNEKLDRYIAMGRRQSTTRESVSRSTGFRICD